MTQRYFVETPILADTATLAGAEAHHLLHVMRLHTGDHVTLFDGSGAEFAATIVKLSRATAELAVLSRAEIDRELPLPVTLAVALPKGDRQRWLVEKAVELGVTNLLPLETDRGVAQPEPAALDRLRRTVIEACKQCGRNRLMQILAPVPWSAYATTPHAGSRWVAHFGGESLAALSESFLASPTTAVELAVGPEGGLTEPEMALAHGSNWRVVDLGTRVLRVETAAMLLAAMAAAAR